MIFSLEIKIIWSLKNPRIAKKKIPRKKNKSKDIMLLDLRLYYKAIVIKQLWHCALKIDTGQ